MADEQPVELLKEVRQLRQAVQLLAVVVACQMALLAVRGWGESVRPPASHSAELFGLQQELHGIREEMVLHRAPPVVIPVKDAGNLKK